MPALGTPQSFPCVWQAKHKANTPGPMGVSLLGKGEWRALKALALAMSWAQDKNIWN
jgi:hypothetical protein